MIKISNEQRDFNEAFIMADGSAVSSGDWLDVICCIVNECQRCPTDSIRDITTEVFEQYEIGLIAYWDAEDDDNPITIHKEKPPHKKKPPPEKKLTGNACAIGDLTMLDNPNAAREKWEPYPVKYALLIEFGSEQEIKKAINDRECRFTVLGE
jgi:hypothetical protein